MWKTTRARLATALAAFLLVALPSTAFAQQMWTDGSGSAVTEGDLMPALASSESYIERYNFKADLDSGGNVKINFVISNMGWGDQTAAAKVHLKLPDHGKYKFKKKKEKGSWSSADDKLRLSVANTTLTYPEKGKYVIEHEGEKSLRVVFENRLPAWQPGNGELKSGSSFYRNQLMAPRASVKGTVDWDGEEVEFSSEKNGYAEHTATNVAPYKMARRFSWFKTFNGNVTVAWKYIDLSEEFGGEDVTWIAVGYNRRLVFSSGDASMKFGRMQPDGTSGYRVPRAAQVEAEDGDDSVKFVHKGSSYDRKDLMKNWGGVARTVASSVTNPYRFDVPGTYKFQMEIQGAKAKVDGEEQFTIDILNEK